jgi:hypothetical protein
MLKVYGTFKPTLHKRVDMLLTKEEILSVLDARRCDHA